MSINTAPRIFGAAPQPVVAVKASSDKVQAEYWLNIGYLSNVKDEDGTYRFVSLSVGIPLDTAPVLDTSSRNESYSFFQQARNQLRDEILKEAAKLAPGEDVIFDAAPNGLAMQVRRVGAPAPAATGVNPFARK